MRLVQQLAHDRDTVGYRLTGTIDRLRQSLAQSPVVVDAGETEIGVGQAPQSAHNLVRADRAGHELVEKAVERRFVHCCPCCHASGVSPVARRSAGRGVTLLVRLLVWMCPQAVADDPDQPGGRVVPGVAVSDHAGAHHQGRHIGRADVVSDATAHLGPLK